MASYHLTAEAEARLAAIFEYSVREFGLAAARSYLAGLHDAFEKLARFPRMGRSFGFVKPGIRRHEHASHIIYYRGVATGVIIVTVLGRQQDPARHLVD